MKDPIKPKQELLKTIDFKKAKLVTTYTISPSFLNMFRSPGVHTIERDTSVIDSQRLLDTLRASRIPREMFGELDHPRPNRPVQVTSTESFESMFGSPVGVSSRGVVRQDGTFDLLSYDIVPNPSTRSAILGGEQMMYNATTTMILPSPKKKKSFLGKVKDYFVGIYKKWKSVER
jgi:hypothetical protein